MANKILVFDKLAYDPAANQYFQLILIDNTTSYNLYVKEVPEPVNPGLASAISSSGAVPVIAPAGAGDVVGSGTTGTVPLWTNGPNSVIGDSLLTQTGSASINLTGDFNLTGNQQVLGTGTKVGIHRAVPSALLHIDGEGQVPASVGTTPGTTGAAIFRTGTAAAGGETTIATTGVGGIGGLVSLNTGVGGQATAAAVASTGGAGGDMSFATGKGGDGSVAGTGSNTGGNAGAINLNLGTGGAANGNTSGANLGGNGGSLNVTCGTGGAATVGSGSLTGGAGGSINITAGTGGAGTTAGGVGGTIQITAGKAGGAVAAGAINFRTSIQNGAPAARLSIEAATGALVFLGPLTAPSTSTDTCKLWEQDAAAGDGNLYALNEAGKNERLTGLATRVTTQFDSGNQTPADVTGLTFNVEAGKIYSFEAELPITTDNASGVKVQIGGTCTATVIGYEVFIQQTGVAVTQGRGAALGAAVGLTATGTSPFVTIMGTITVANAGTLTVQGSRNGAGAGNCSFLVAGYFKLIPQGS